MTSASWEVPFLYRIKITSSYNINFLLLDRIIQVEPGQTFDSPFYPQVWPNLLESEQQALENGLEADAKLSSTLYFVVKILSRKLKEKLSGSS